MTINLQMLFLLIVLFSIKNLSSCKLLFVKEYKPPAAKDIPQDFRVTLLKNSRNPNGILSSKGYKDLFRQKATSVNSFVRSS